MRTDDRPRRTERYMVEDLTDELLFYDAEGNKIHILNGTARAIYLRCDGRRSVADLVRAIVSEFDVDEETARKDTVEVLGRLIALEIVGLADTPAPSR